jgi:hypothetical protein
MVEDTNRRSVLKAGAAAGSTGLGVALASGAASADCDGDTDMSVSGGFLPEAVVKLSDDDVDTMSAAGLGGSVTLTAIESVTTLSLVGGPLSAGIVGGLAIHAGKIYSENNGYGVKVSIPLDKKTLAAYKLGELTDRETMPSDLMTGFSVIPQEPPCSDSSSGDDNSW